MEEAEGKKVFLIGGGIGIPPMLETAKQLKAEKTAVLGYRDELFLNDEFTRYADVYVATEDGSAGTKGNVLNAICERGLGRGYFCLWPNADASCTERVCSREEYHMLDIPWKKEWRVESEHVLDVSANQKRLMRILWCITNVFVKMDRYS